MDEQSVKELFPRVLNIALKLAGERSEPLNPWDAVILDKARRVRDEEKIA